VLLFGGGGAIWLNFVFCSSRISAFGDREKRAPRSRIRDATKENHSSRELRAIGGPPGKSSQSQALGNAKFTAAAATVHFIGLEISVRSIPCASLKQSR